LREIGMCHASDLPMAVMFLDLDGFKEVNDLFGHQAGDQLLKEATLRLRGIVGEKGLLARVGGDEFSILLTSKDAHALALEMAPQIVEVLAKPFCGNEIAMVVSASIGVALGEAGQGVDDLSRFADVAMYAAKAGGKNCWRIYNPEMDEGREIRKLLENELREAVAGGTIDVLFQPIVEAREGKISSVEALARWTSPTQGPIGPAIFIPVAEESGLIVKLGDLVLRKACMAARDWDVCLSVNISPAQFWHQSLVEDILAILKECDFPAHRLELEITEGYLLSRPDLAADVIHRIRSHGIRIALDDFGTGFASIGYLRRFELDRLKLDRSFVEFVDSSQQSADVAKAVIGLSHALNLPITAEGVETSPQALFLMLAGCQRLQGWHYGRAVSGEEIATMIEVPQVIESEPVRIGLAK
jgi:diguanylate cyclase (GGDEF)-like protein